VTDEPRAKFVVATEDLDNAGREDLLGKFAEFECGVGSERARRVMSIRYVIGGRDNQRWLHNDAVAGEHSRCDLSNRCVCLASFLRYDEQLAYRVLGGLGVLCQLRQTYDQACGILTIPRTNPGSHAQRNIAGSHDFFIVFDTFLRKLE
jgi:hypothetical protein